MNLKKIAENNVKPSLKDSVARLKGNSYTFTDVELIYLELLRQFINKPDKLRENKLSLYITKFVPFKKQLLSPWFTRELLGLIDQVIANRQIDLFARMNIYILCLFANTIARDEEIVFLEKALDFLVPHGANKYPQMIEDLKLSLSAIKGDKELEAMAARGEFSQRPGNEVDDHISGRYREMNDMLLDMGTAVRDTTLRSHPIRNISEILPDENGQK
jgi:hypothetical protein